MAYALQSLPNQQQPRRALLVIHQEHCMADMPASVPPLYTIPVIAYKGTRPRPSGYLSNRVQESLDGGKAPMHSHIAIAVLLLLCK